MALVDRVIASHYAKPVKREIVSSAILRAGPSDDAEALAQLSPGEKFRMLDESIGWAWGYAGDDGRVGYVRSESVGSA